MHITKAMQLVAASKIKRATAVMERSRAYADAMREAFARLGDGDGAELYFRKREDLPTCLIVVAGDRGLAGGYNNNIFKLLATERREGDLLLPIGARACDYVRRRGYTTVEEIPSVEGFGSAEAARAARLLTEMYKSGEIGGVRLLSTAYRSMLSQEATASDLLPLTKGESADRGDFMLYEPSAAAVMAALIPEYLAGLLFGAATESFCSELAARRNAMDSATSNAEEMIDTLTLAYNRARQGAITQEITEIVGGAAADE